MKKTILLSLTTCAVLMGAVESKAGLAQWTHENLVLPALPKSNPGSITFLPTSSHFPGCDLIPTPVCVADISPISFWFDPPLEAATGLDLAATRSQRDRSIKAKEALADLEKHLEGGCSKNQQDGTDSSLSGTDVVPVAPEMILADVDAKDGFQKVRSAAQNYLFETNECDHDCVLERQNTWLLTSLSLVIASGDKVLAASKDMSAEYGALVKDFNSQTSPKGMYGATSKITLHTHVQQNDINALYARDLEVNALNAARESDSTEFITGNKN